MASDLRVDNLKKADGTALITAGVVQSGLSVPASSGASWVFISKGTASDTAALDFTVGSTYNYYMFLLQNLKPIDNSSYHLYAWATVDAFSTIENGSGDYITTLWKSYYNGSANGSGQDLLNDKLFYAANVGHDTGDSGVSGQLLLTKPSQAGGQKKHFDYTYAKYEGNDYLISAKGSSVLTSTTSAVNGIRWAMSTGNLGSGSIALYGIKDA